MTIEFFDSHAHLTGSPIYDHIDEILQRAKEAKVSTIVNICTDAETLEKGLKLAKRYPWIYNAAATTPHDVEKEGEQLFSLMAHHAHNGDLIAVGETGLDYHYQHSPPQTQKHFLKKYLQLALECQLPVVIHCRDAFEEFFEILDAVYVVKGKYAPGVLHCFTGNSKEAEQVLERGWYLSLSGIVTFKKSEELREVAKNVPLNQLLIETDTPYLAPKSQRGKMNEPSYLLETAEVISLAKKLSIEEVASASADNARRLFKIR